MEAVDGVEVVFELESRKDIEWLAIFDGKYVGEEAAENVERRKAHQSGHLIRDILIDALMLCYHGGMRQDCCLRKPTGPTSCEVSCGSSFRRLLVR